MKKYIDSGRRYLSASYVEFLGVDLDIGGSIQNIAMLTDLSNGVYRNTLDQNGAGQQTSLVAGLYVDNGASMQPILEVTSTRYFNSKQTRDHHILVTKVKSETSPTKHSIYMLNKATGEIYMTPLSVKLL